MGQDNLEALTNPISEFPGFNLRTTANAAMSKLSGVFSALDLKIAEASILVVVQANPGCRQVEIGKTLNIASANLTPTLHRLEDKGLISRVPLDGRTNALQLTKRGQTLASRCLAAMESFETFLIQAIKPLDAATFNSTLQSIMAALSE